MDGKLDLYLLERPTCIGRPLFLAPTRPQAKKGGQ